MIDIKGPKMEFDEIKARIRKTEPDMMRMDSENYFEAVIGHARLEEAVCALEGVFGAPAWPSDKKLSRDTERLIKNIGGLRKGQTLYILNDGSGCSVFAMLWPWQDGQRVTIKMSKI
ncbi:MAG: hypothetical protein Q8R14_00700 [Candidatus Omnitrophota bacterium]|nr:hypothetical protein [Candidatus Omnitrophota bacterium]